MKIYLNPYGQGLLSEELVKARWFDVMEIPSLSETLVLLDSDTLLYERRGPSAHRFKLLLQILEHGSQKTRFFKATYKNNCKLFEIVAVLSDGSLASTSPRSSRLGMPCRDVLSLFIAGYIEINILSHFHHCYQQAHVKILRQNGSDTYFDEMTCNITNKNADRCCVTRDASFEHAERITRKEWTSIQKLESISNAQFPLLDEVDDDVTIKKETWDQLLRRTFFTMLPGLKKGSEAATLFFEAADAVQQEAVEKAQRQKRAMVSQHPDITIPASIPSSLRPDNTQSKRKRSSIDNGKSHSGKSRGRGKSNASI